MGEPSVWAMERASRMMCEQTVWAPVSLAAAPAIKAAVREACVDIALALDAARRDALEEALVCVPGGQICDPQEVADAIRAITDQEPSHG